LQKREGKGVIALRFPFLIAAAGGFSNAGSQLPGMENQVSAKLAKENSKSIPQAFLPVVK